MRILVTVLAPLLFGACNNLDPGTDLKPISKNNMLEEPNSSTSDITPSPPSYSSGVGFSGSGKKAAYKEFVARREDASKAVHINLEFFGDTEISESSTSAIEMKWTFLSESQDIVNQFADMTIPTVDKSHADFYQITFKQIGECKGYSKITINGSLHYIVQGTCVTHPTLSIPKTFNNKIFLNGKLIHDVNSR